MAFQDSPGLIRRHWFRFKVGSLSLSAIALVTLAGCTPPPGVGQGGESAAPQTSASPPVTSDVPASSSPLDNVRIVAHDSVNLYSLIKDGQWSAAQSVLEQLQTDIQAVDATVTTQLGLSSGQLSSGLAALETAITDRDREAGMREANQLVLTAASLARTDFDSGLSSILMLGYYGRSLEMDVLANSPTDFETTTEELRYTWQQFRPEVAQLAGDPMAAQGDALIARLQDAESNAEYGQLATEIVAMGSRLESLLIPRISQSNLATP